MIVRLIATTSLFLAAAGALAQTAAPPARPIAALEAEADTACTPRAGAAIDLVACDVAKRALAAARADDVRRIAESAVAKERDIGAPETSKAVICTPNQASSRTGGDC